MKTTCELVALVATATLMLSAGTASATLIGDTVDCATSAIGGYTCDTPTAIVGGSSEFILSTGANDRFEVNIGSDDLLITWISPATASIGSPVTLTLSDLDWVGSPMGEIVGIANFMTTAGGIDASDITWSAHSLDILLGGGSSWAPGQFLSFDLVTSDPSAVPVPATLSLIFIGLAGLVSSRRRQARAKATA